MKWPKKTFWWPKKTITKTINTNKTLKKQNWRIKKNLSPYELQYDESQCKLKELT